MARVPKESLLKEAVSLFQGVAGLERLATEDGRRVAFGEIWVSTVIY